VNANRNPEAYARFGHRVIADEIAGFAGPLAGFERGLAHAAGSLVATVPCDSPFLPTDLIARLRAALEARDAQLAVAKTGDQAHPVFCLMRRGVHASLERFLAAGERKIDKWYAQLAVAEVAFDDEADAFLNINTREELAGLEPRG
jgi:molybdopterin-guanine dinucleotide biosynthesis protein A